MNTPTWDSVKDLVNKPEQIDFDTPYIDLWAKSVNHFSGNVSVTENPTVTSQIIRDLVNKWLISIEPEALKNITVNVSDVKQQYIIFISPEQRNTITDKYIEIYGTVRNLMSYTYNTSLIESLFEYIQSKLQLDHITVTYNDTTIRC